jgi:prevent-host-death family protein
MKMVTVREFRANPTRALGSSRKAQDVVLTNNGKPVALLWPVDEDNLEESLKMARRARAERAVHNMRMAAQSSGLDDMSLDDINALVAEARAEVRTEPGKAKGPKRKA